MTRPTDNLDRVPPHNTEAEMSVLGCILLDAEVCDDVAMILRDGDFYRDANAKLFAQMVAMHNEGLKIDLTLLIERLKTSGQFEAIGGHAYLAEVAHTVAVASHATHYAEIVRGKSTRRQILDAAYQAVDDAFHAPDRAEDVLERAEASLAKIRGHEVNDPITIHDATIKAVENILAIQERGNTTGVLTGLPAFDNDMGGLFPGELTILAARPGIGKTSFALQVAYHVAMRPRLVYFVSLEMSAVELSTRLACSLSGVSSRLVRTGRLTEQDTSRLTAAMNEQAVAALHIHDQASVTVAAIRRQIRKRKKHGLTLAVIDYLQLLTPEDRKIPREQQVARMTTALKHTAREYDIPILCLCQLNRQADGEEQPKLAHLRESGAIEQDADMVLFLAPHKPTGLDRNNASLIIAKNRNGETGILPLDWHPQRTRFTCTEPICEEWAP